MKAERYIRHITEDKGRYLPLLLLGDEQEELIEGYLDRGDLFVCEEAGEALAVCVVTREGPELYELQNIAVAPAYQRQGLGRAMVDFVWTRYPDLRTLQLGTGDSPATLGFYRALGFQEVRREKDYFTCRYDHPIYEDGVLLKDRVCFQKTKGL